MIGPYVTVLFVIYIAVLYDDNPIKSTLGAIIFIALQMCNHGCIHLENKTCCVGGKVSLAQGPTYFWKIHLTDVFGFYCKTSVDLI